VLAAADFAAALALGSSITRDAFRAASADVTSICDLRCVRALAAALLSRALEAGFLNTLDAFDAAFLPVSRDMLPAPQGESVVLRRRDTRCARGTFAVPYCQMVVVSMSVTAVSDVQRPPYNAGGRMPVMIQMDQLGSELRRRRKDLSLSLRDVQEETRVSAATLSRVERGSPPDPHVVQALTKWLDVSVYTGVTSSTEPETDEDLRRVISVHLRAKKKLPAAVAAALVASFEVLLRLETERARGNQALSKKKRR
jgi:transcriptional regulator with XRE-family HTH domain